jgi:hypothetical protein
MGMFGTSHRLASQELVELEEAGVQRRNVSADSDAALTQREREVLSLASCQFELSSGA